MNRLGKVLILTAVLFALGTVSQVPGQRKATPRVTIRGERGVQSSAALLPPPVQRRVDTFEKVWSTIRENYFDPTFSSLDWDKIRAEFAPKARAAKTDAELHRLLAEMLVRLDRSHLAIIPPEVYEAIEKARADAREREQMREDRRASGGGIAGEEPDELNIDDPLTEYGTGIHLRLIDNKLVVTRLDKDSAAEYAGLRTGHIIESINDVSMAMLLAKLDVYSTGSRRLGRYLPYEIVEYFLNGEKDSYIRIGYLDEKDERKEITFRRERIKSQTVSVASNFPDTQLSFEAASLSDDIGLIRFNTFAVPVVTKFCDALTEFKGKKAIVIDLRGNLGGNLGAVIGLAGMLSDRNIDLGTSIYRSGPEPLNAQSKAKHYKGRIVVLVDGMTFSAAEMLASSLQDSRRAIVIGDRTPGETLPAITVDLPTGARLLYPIANYKSPSGRLLEGIGVTPEHVVPLDRRSLLDGRDVQIEAAIRLIGDDKAFAKISSPAAAPSLELRAPLNVELAAAPPVNTGGGGAPPPPPPPPRKNPPLRVLAEVTVKAPPPPPAVKERPLTRDAKAAKVINEFAAAAGGAEAFAAVKNYTMTGKLEMELRGVRQTFDYKSYREFPNKYAEISTSPSTGEVRGIYDGTVMHLKSDFGIDRKTRQASGIIGDLEYLAPIAAIKEMADYPRLAYLGVFDRSGRKVHVIQAESSTGATVALGFDVQTGMLASLASSWVTISYSDFRKVGNLMLPFQIENGRFMTIRLDEVKVNTQIDASVFRPKEHCFDKP